MICYPSHSEALQAETFLERNAQSSFPGFTLPIIRMPYPLDPASAFCYYDTVLSRQRLEGAICWQIRILHYQSLRLKSALLFEPAIRIPSSAAKDPRAKEEIAGQLYRAAADVLDANCPMVYLWAHPQAEVPDGFGEIGSLNGGYLRRPPGQYQVKDVRLWNTKTDLYPLYLQFMNHFDASFVLDRMQFSRMLQSQGKKEHRIYVLYADPQEHNPQNPEQSEERQPAAFCLAGMQKGEMVLYGMVYRDGQALLDLVNWFGSLWKKMLLCYTGSENLEALFDFEKIETLSLLYGRCNLTLMERLLHEKHLSFADVWNRLDKPVWNLLF